LCAELKSRVGRIMGLDSGCGDAWLDLALAGYLRPLERYIVLSVCRVSGSMLSTYRYEPRFISDLFKSLSLGAFDTATSSTRSYRHAHPALRVSTSYSFGCPNVLVAFSSYNRPH
jgi:hypothetical protein